LARHGYTPTVDRERSTKEIARVLFDVEGVRHSLVVQECDPAFFHIFVSYALDVPEAPLLRLLEVANETNQGLKGAKVTVLRESHKAVFAIEGFSSRAPTKADFERQLSQVARAGSRFFGLLRWAGRPMALA
jgi:hypothetical protein